MAPLTKIFGLTLHGMKINMWHFKKSPPQSASTAAQAGFTLIELILYIALISIFLSAVITFAWDIIYSHAKSSTQQTVLYNLRLASERITYEIRNARAINSVSATSLCLASADAARNPTKLYLASNELRIGWGGGNSTCATTTNDQALTSAEVNVTALTFQNLTTAGTASQHIQFTIGITSTANRQEWQYSQTFSSSAEVRSH
ncbi:MAG TPA: prepilin-type N-terminal cleavage/methylation domain-containing protein [Vitreimonas sp.]|nr:prepilin-type N-terminal cleavage/methylation domain-containing protein [Vitreimonas sp.]